MNAVLTVLLADNSWDMHGDVDSGWMILMIVAMVLFWGAIILGIFWLVRGASSGWRWGGERKETPSEILERRFAEGAISVEDYHERRNIIASGTRDDQVAGDT